MLFRSARALDSVSFFNDDRIGVNNGASRIESVVVVGIDCCSRAGSMLRSSSGGVKTLVRMLLLSIDGFNDWRGGGC